MSSTSLTVGATLPLLTVANWYQWEQLALNSITIFGNAGRAIQSNIPYVPVEPHVPINVRFKEEIIDPTTNEPVIRESTRPWNDATDWPLYTKAMDEYRTCLLYTSDAADE